MQGDAQQAEGGSRRDLVVMTTEWLATNDGFGDLWAEIQPCVERSVRQQLRKRLVRGQFTVDNEDAVQEVTQEVAFRLLRLPGKDPDSWFDPTRGKGGTDGLRAWLCGISKNAVADYCVRFHDAKSGRKVVAESALPRNELSEVKSFVKAAVAKIDVVDSEMPQIMNDSIAELPDDLRGLIRLKLAEDLSERGLATWTGINVSTIHRRLTAAYGLLRVAMRQRGIDDDWFLAA